MKKILGILITFVLGFLISPLFNKVFATAQDCSAMGISAISITPASFIEGDGTTQIDISFDATNISNQDYLIKSFDDRSSPVWGAEDTTEWVHKGDRSPIIDFVLDSQKALTSDDVGAASKDTKHIYLFSEELGPMNRWCYLGSYVVQKSIFVCSQPIIVSQKRLALNDDGSTSVKTCFHNSESSCFDSQNPIDFSVDGLIREIPNRAIYADYGFWSTHSGMIQPSSDDGAKWSRNFNENDYTLRIKDKDGPVYAEQNCSGFSFTVVNGCPPESCEEEQTLDPETLGPDVFSLCDQIPEDNTVQRTACLDCTRGGDDDLEGIWTAIGCIKKDPKIIIGKLIEVGLGVGGGFTLITFLAAGFIFSTSQGSPDKVKNAKEMMTASVVGLVFIIFSVSILQFIGWSILKIPGFGG
ncbi:pilin [Patescibacteria group bacterium]|nr:pilin [Patescibacteria group bacterium]